MHPNRTIARFRFPVGGQFKFNQSCRLSQCPPPYGGGTWDGPGRAIILGLTSINRKLGSNLWLSKWTIFGPPLLCEKIRSRPFDRTNPV
jgi:hypothetical protein